jgi:hypothetical protein
MILGTFCAYGILCRLCGVCDLLEVCLLSTLWLVDARGWTVFRCVGRNFYSRQFRHVSHHPHVTFATFFCIIILTPPSFCLSRICSCQQELYMCRAAMGLAIAEHLLGAEQKGLLIDIAMRTLKIRFSQTVRTRATSIPTMRPFCSAI